MKKLYTFLFSVFFIFCFLFFTVADSVFAQTCSDGLSLGARKCDPSDSSKFLICVPGSNPEYRQTFCPANYICSEGNCVQPTCSNGALNGAYTCNPPGMGNVDPRVVFRCCATCQNQYIQQSNLCDPGQVCFEGSFVQMCTGPTPTSPPQLRCTDGTLNGDITCQSDISDQSFICRARQDPQFEFYQQCSSVERCVRGVGCTDGQTQPTNTPPQNQPPTTVIPTPDPKGSSNLTSDSFLILVNPLNVGFKFGGALGVFNVLRFDKPSDIVNALIPFLFVFAGLILFIMLLWGGFEMLSSAATPDSKNAGQQRITAAIIGFVLLFVSYWIAQIVQFITGVNILG